MYRNTLCTLRSLAEFSTCGFRRKVKICVCNIALPINFYFVYRHKVLNCDNNILLYLFVSILRLPEESYCLMKLILDYLRKAS